MARIHRPSIAHRSSWAILFVWTFATLLPAPAFAKAFTFGGVVVKIHDGDTISVVRRGHAEKVRLAGIDSPEIGQAFGQRAKNLTTRLASEQWSRSEFWDQMTRAVGSAWSFSRTADP